MRNRPIAARGGLGSLKDAPCGVGTGDVLAVGFGIGASPRRRAQLSSQSGRIGKLRRDGFPLGSQLLQRRVLQAEAALHFRPENFIE